MKMDNKITEQIQAILDSAKTEEAKFTEKGNASAGTRLRANLQEIVNLCKIGRKNVTDTKNAKKVK